MCRIAGIAGKSQNAGKREGKVALMCSSLRHGGPDDEGIFSTAGSSVVFGHRRLSIIDLTSNGHQPMPDAGDNAWITFNGEIYNYPELKAELIQAGVAFRSNTDTEVILAAYLHWGTNAFAKLRGMFAFALYDVRSAVVYLVRDTNGIKPLYYYIAGNELNFASEVRALKEAGIATETDAGWMVRFLAYGHLPEPYTTLKNVFSLPKGHFLCWKLNSGDWSVSSYQTDVKTSSINTVEDAKHAINAALKLAVKRQLIADASIGVFLSGGIDSSLITLLANQEKQSQLKTVSVFFNEKNYDERPYQQIVLKKIQGEKFLHLIKQQEFETFFPDILNQMDMPTTDGINTWFISKYAHECDLKAVLSGIGADELFGGYPSFDRIKYLRYLRTIPAIVLKNMSRALPDQYKKLSFLQYDHALADYLFLRGLFTLHDIAAILDMGIKEVEDIIFTGAGYTKTGFYNKEQAAAFEENFYMQNQLLRDTDVMSMSHGLEVRVPFLDEDFRQTVKSIPPHIRFDNTRPKKLLVDSFADYLPEAIWNRTKMGFSFPLQKWMATVNDISDESFYKGKHAKQVITKFKAGKTHWSKVFALYQIRAHV